MAEPRIDIEVSVLDVPYTQRLLLAAIDFLTAFEAADMSSDDWWLDSDEHAAKNRAFEAAKQMRAILDERLEM